MDVRIFAGKGGVGKTTTAVAAALLLAEQGHNTALIDYDGGHSVCGTLGMDDRSIPPNVLRKVREHLLVAVIEESGYTSVTKAQEKGWTVHKYLAQFEEDLGIIGFADMVYEFFGVPTDISTLMRFIRFVQILLRLRQEGCDHIVIDVEPTAGLERLLVKAPSLVRSLRNLSKSKLQLMALRVQWPDIAAFLRSRYMEEIDFYAGRIETVTSTLRSALYYLVCVPEMSPIRQTFAVRSIIEQAGGTVKACVLNRAQGLDPSDDRYRLLRKHRLPVIELGEYPELHNGHAAEALAAMGDKLAAI